MRARAPPRCDGQASDAGGGSRPGCRFLYRRGGSDDRIPVGVNDRTVGRGGSLAFARHESGRRRVSGDGPQSCRCSIPLAGRTFRVGILVRQREALGGRTRSRRCRRPSRLEVRLVARGAGPAPHRRSAARRIRCIAGVGCPWRIRPDRLPGQWRPVPHRGLLAGHRTGPRGVVELRDLREPDVTADRLRSP